MLTQKNLALMAAQLTEIAALFDATPPRNLNGENVLIFRHAPSLELAEQLRGIADTLIDGVGEAPVQMAERNIPRVFTLSPDAEMQQLSGRGRAVELRPIDLETQPLCGDQVCHREHHYEVRRIERSTTSDQITLILERQE